MAGQIAIVGAGPSGCYVAQALLKGRPDLEVDLIDALPVPFGLIRYGVAADHQGTKAVTRQFARIFERQGARFFGNVHIGRDVALCDLRDAYDAVVLAAGLSRDRPLSLPGDARAGIFGSGALIRALHEHPHSETLPDLGPNPLILGNGNVAIDLLRLLCKTPNELQGTDLGEGPSRWLASNDLRAITIVGRSPAGRAKFDPVMIRELARLENVSIEVSDAGASDEPEEAKRIEALSEIHGHGSGSVTITFRFGLQPIAVEGADRVTGLRVSGPGGEEVVDASSILTAIGFESGGDLDHCALVNVAAPREAGILADRLYSAGWFGRGPRGTIAESRAEAQSIAAMILAELAPEKARKGSEIFAAVSDIVDYAGWQRVDRQELSGSVPGRIRRKLASITDILNVATARENDN